MRQVFRSSDEFLVIDEASFWDECLWTDTNIFLCYDNFFSRLKPIWFQPMPPVLQVRGASSGSEGVTALTLSPRVMVTGGGDGGIKLWNIQTSSPTLLKTIRSFFQGGNSLFGFWCESLVLWQKRANHSFAIFKRVCSLSLRKERQKRFAPIALFKKATRAKKPSTRANSQPCIFQT